MTIRMTPGPIRSACVGLTIVFALVIGGGARLRAEAPKKDESSTVLTFNQAMSVLQQWLGMWNVVERHFDSVGNIVGETKGTEEIRPILDDRAVRRIYRSAGTSQTYEAHGTFTFSETQGAFVGFWFDNQSVSGPTASRAGWNPKTRTMLYEYTQTAPGGVIQNYRIVERFLSEEHREATTYRVRGKALTKLLEVSYVRAGPCPEQKTMMRIIYDGLE